MKILKYQIAAQIGGQQILSACEVQTSDERYEDNLALARAEAYNGEVTAEDVPDAPQELGVSQRLDELEALMAQLLFGGDAQ